MEILIDDSQHCCTVQEQQQAAPDGGQDIRVDLSAAEWDEWDGLSRRMVASAKIAAASADVAAPLLLSSDLRVRRICQLCTRCRKVPLALHAPAEDKIQL